LETFILDTSAFTEARLKKALNARSTEDVVRFMLDLIREARLTLHSKFYMTPSTWSELRRLLIGQNVSLDVIQELMAWITVKAPDKLSMRIPASVFSEYISDIRRRLYKGLRVAEAAIKKAVRECSENEDSERCIGEAVKGLREKYREATRKGLVDSVEDFDTILLALEMKAIVVTSDAGIRKLSEQLGIIVVDPEDFIAMLQRMIKGVREASERKQ